MLSRAHVPGCVALLLIVGASSLVCGEPPAAPVQSAPLRPNPRAEGWAAHAPGAWVRLKEEIIPTAPKTGSEFEYLHFLVEVDPHEVVLWEGQRVAGEKGREFEGGLRVRDRKVPLEEEARTWTAVPPSGPVKQSKVSIPVAGKELECSELEFEVEGPDSEVSQVRVWLHPDVPGKVVRREVEGRWGRRQLHVVGYGSKPDGTFTFPLRLKPEEELIESFRYTQWAKLPVGAWVQTRHEMTNNMGSSSDRTRTTLLEVRPACLFLETRTFDESGTADGGVPEVQKGQPAPLDAARKSGDRTRVERIEVRRRVPAGSVESLGAGGPSESHVKKAPETLVVAGRMLVCDVNEFTMTDAKDPLRLVMREWSHADVPEEVVKRVAEATDGKFRVLETWIVEDWRVPRK